MLLERRIEIIKLKKISQKFQRMINVEKIIKQDKDQTGRGRNGDRYFG